MEELRPAPVATGLPALCTVLGIPAQAGVVRGIALDTRLVREGDLFAALPGAHAHGAQFLSDAKAAGAAAIFTDRTGAELIGDCGLPVLVVDEPRARLGDLARIVYPGKRPVLVGVTGTNGKTTTTHLVQAALESAGRPTAVVGTLGVRFRELHAYSGRTTPEAPSLHATLQALAEAGARVAAMEVSSHALALHRVDGLRFDVAAFLGLSQDHLDFHGDMESYFEAKARLFDAQIADRAVINVDDAWGRRLVERTRIPHVTYAISTDAEWTAVEIAALGDGRTSFTARGPLGDLPVVLPMPGDFNVANALAALACVDAIGGDVRGAAAGLAAVSVPGRFQAVTNTRGIAAYADYAHTPDAVERVLRVARASTRGRLIAVLGCGGDRDPVKRPLMAQAASALADDVIITDDNPRSEDPATIRRAMLEGVRGSRNVREVGDRREAIRMAVAAARAGDCVMVLGKGHETGQEIAGVVHPFDDREELQRALGAES